MPSRRHPRLSAAWVAAILSLAYGAFIYAKWSNLPLWSDAIGYSYRTASWIAQNGMSPLLTGEGRGSQGMGHPAAYMWLWALLMRVAGDTAAVAHLMPAAFSALAVFSAFLLGRSLGGRTVGAWTAITLALSPLFLSQAAQPLMDVPFAAFAALSLERYARRRFGQAALFCMAAVACRETALLLALVYVFLELSSNGFRNPRRLALFCSPALVMLATALLNLAANGYLVNPDFAGDHLPLAPGWLWTRLRQFAGHLYAGNGRWLLVVTALAAGLTRVSTSRMPVAAVLVLLSPAILYPPGRLLWLAAAGAATLVLLLRKGELPGAPGLALILFPAVMVLFHVFIVLFAPDDTFNLFRYILAAYPALLAGGYSYLRRRGSVRSVHAIGLVLTAMTFASGMHIESAAQPEATQEFLDLPYAEASLLRYAASRGDTLVLPESDMDLALHPAVGYSASPLPARTLREGDMLDPSAAYTVLIPYAEHLLPDWGRLVGSALPASSALDTLVTWRSETLRLTLLRISPRR